MSKKSSPDLKQIIDRMANADKRTVAEITIENASEEALRFLKFVHTLQYLLRHFPNTEQPEGSAEYKFAEFIARMNAISYQHTAKGTIYDHRSLGEKLHTLWDAIQARRIKIVLEDTSRSELQRGQLGIKLRKQTRKGDHYAEILISSEVTQHQHLSAFVGIIAHLVWLIESTEQRGEIPSEGLSPRASAVSQKITELVQAFREAEHEQDLPADFIQFIKDLEDPRIRTPMLGFSDVTSNSSLSLAALQRFLESIQKFEASNN